MSAGNGAAHAITAEDVRVELALDGVKSVMAGGFLVMAEANRKQTAVLEEIRDGIKTLIELMKGQP